MIKKIAMTVFAALSMTAQAGRVLTETFQSELLGAEVKYNVYLPNGFEQSDTKYPVIYLLHGFTDDYTAWRDRGQMQTVADELIEAGEAREMVIVMPNAGGPDIMNTWNGYLNMPGWPYEDFFFKEFMPAIENKYRIVGNKEHRAIMGLSMGGGGSTIYAQRHPETFSSCYAMSGWLEFSGKNLFPENRKPYLLQESMREHSALTFLEKADAATLNQLRTVKWFFDCGDDDFLFDLSVRIHQLMRSKRIKDELRVRNGQHNWEYWHQAIRLALPFASRNFGL